MKRLQCCTALAAVMLVAGAPAFARAQTAQTAPAAPAAPLPPAAAPAPAPAPVPAAPVRPVRPAPQARQRPPAPASPVNPVPAPVIISTFRSAPSALSIVLVVGEMQGSTTSELPEAARKALDELKAFLPFKNYRLYDAGVIGAPSENYGATLRLRGQEGRGQTPQLFEVTIERQSGSSLDVAMRDVGAGQSAGARGNAITANGKGWADSLMSASVRVRAGETVVVGTSRIRGDFALVLLITGLPATQGTTPARAPGAAPF